MGNTDNALADLTTEQLNLLRATRTKFLIERRSSLNTRLTVRMHGHEVDEHDFEALLHHRLIELDITTAIPNVRGETVSALFYNVSNLGRALLARSEAQP